MTGSGHVPVLGREVVDLLGPKAGGVYVDGTLGGAGHAEAILEASAPGGRLVGCDRDPDAVAAGRRRLARFGDRATLVHARFSELPDVLADLGVGPVNGLLVDVGLSSTQLDDPARGFSFSREGPLDMRMDPSRGESALELIRRLGTDQLAAILKDYGEERFARRIASRLEEEARAHRLSTTVDLARAVEACIPAKAARRQPIHPATRTFQALRIAVNRELDELAALLEVFPELLAPGGRFVAISFHSLEDRLVKRRLRDLAWSSSLPPKYAREAGERVHPVCRVLTRKPVTAGEPEIRENPRARSARLRACEKVE